MGARENKTELMVIGGSAGSLQVILEMVKKLDSPIAFPILVVVHRKAHSVSILPALLQQFSPVDVIEIEDKTDIDVNGIYIVPADYHLLFESKNSVALDSSEKLNYSRPSIDVTFKSAAEMYGENLTGVLLSGANADGVEGLNYIKRNKGQVWIQDPETAEVRYMPQYAVERVNYDRLITPGNLAEHINKLYSAQ
ncbi:MULTISPECIES: chemotaxis protein CheB [Chryseobacterium]|uniref:protein-glutamate methylesterase n=1 Tax=Chryseobacterium camelliae TaxID=1265445 RepID=A0ABU0TDP9_9FLAO|nr:MULTISPECIES: chemotaxis protein CheB [Chryseobacterium]MDT3407245.1 two-component system chemotaxis response regulator CheB [Pseudacidovorax intermedius]MDQ1094966.1 two-component system chemotaxis response regulator CheB [Chryseobacterium camelliae]MDQ1098905.1 two-component system chemotaxis response regulator CheB [Chryseobacterium sp. SORGH_AS_1048]MDR6086254.1 two-component system chemotaxis response regulator CheB [Chryseobacterium sp. SORGH_AS_0909]MDR6130625.1 two-component system 